MTNLRIVRFSRTALLSSCGAVLCLASPAHAQSEQQATTPPPQAEAPAAPGTGEIVVTAQRREQSLQSVGISITALSGETLARAGITSPLGLAAQVPGLQFDSGSGGGVNAFVTIRGVSQVDPAEHQEAPNAFYLDEVYVPTPSMVGYSLYDVARAEALRGPQGTLFGRNSTGGLLQFVTNDPSNEFKGYFDASYANYNTVRFEGAVGGPLTQGLTFRLAGFVNEGNGYFKNYAPGGRDSFEKNAFGLRGKLAADLGGGWSAKLTGSINKEPKHREGVYKSAVDYTDANGVPQFLPANVDAYGTGPGNDPFGYRDPYSSFHAGNFSNVGFLRKEYNYATLKIEGPVLGAKLTSISNYSHNNIDYFEDSDGTPNGGNNFGNGGTTRQFSEELRLSGDTGRFNWTIGTYFIDIRGKYYIDLLLPYVNFYTANRYTQHTQSYAVFAQGEYKFTDTLKLTIGGRYTHDSKDFSSQTYDFSTPAHTLIYDFSPATVGALARMRHGDWTGKAQIDFTPSRNLLLYAGVSRGFRGGGFNASPDGTIPLAKTPFGPEVVVDYEAGAKFRLLDGRLSVRASGFYYDYSGYQAFNFTNLVGSVGNNPAYNYGGELELNATPMRGLNISAGASLFRGKVLDYHTAIGTVIDTEPVKAPHFTFNALASKEFDLGDYQLRIQYDTNYVSDSQANLFPAPITLLPASWVHNARVSIGRNQYGWELYAFVRNFTNTARETFAYDLTFIGDVAKSYAPPRTYGIGFRKTF